MNTPQNLYDTVTVQNIDTDPFEVVYNKQTYGTIEPGQTRSLPRFLASHAMKHLIDHILNKRGVMVNNQLKRQELANKMLINVQKVVAPVNKTEDQVLKEKVDQLNAPTDLDLLMAKNEISENAPTPPQTPPPSPAPTPPSEMSIEELEALLAEKKAVNSGEETPEETLEAKSVAEEPKAEITRDELYAWAEQEMGITIYADEKTKKSLDEKSVEEVKKELGYE